MQIFDFGRIRDAKIKIAGGLGRPLGLVDGSQVFSMMFKYEYNDKASYEMVLSTLGPENYREICNITFVMLDVPGSCAQVAKFMGERNIDILNSISLSMISEVCMVWKMVVDLSYYGDSAALREEFDTLKRQKSSQLSKVDAMNIEAANISERYTKGILPLGSNVRVKSIKKAQKAPTLIRNGEFDIPADYMGALEGFKDGDPVIMIADQDSWVLSITPLDRESKLAKFVFIIPDKPGAIFDITSSMADHNINLLSVSTKVLVYYDTMSLTVVADVRKYPGSMETLKERTEQHLSKLKGKFQLIDFQPLEF